MSHSHLTAFIQQYQDAYPQLADYNETLQRDGVSIALYDQIYPLVEQILWHKNNQNDTNNILADYQRLFREQENLIQQDQRFDFILSIPIADRPQHLKSCLEAIYQLCERFNYGGKNEQGQYQKVQVIVVEDSRYTDNIQADRVLCEEYTQQGLTVHHYVAAEQLALMTKLPTEQQTALQSIIGTATAEEGFYLKGQAHARNLAYLKLLDIDHDRSKTLYYFVDSDQLFQVNIATSDKDERRYAINFFYIINRIFSQHDIHMLTGKLVGDPPVSPSVMTANFLSDVIAFFEQLATYDATGQCQFHPQHITKPSAAAYHDMAGLFGLEAKQTNYDYRCELTGTHDHRDCLNAFADRINYFFFGEHLTRKTYFEYDQFDKLSAARTVYPGNYITTFAGLKYVIPFGDLRLRMSGPTAGRLIQQEINDQFVTANIPMLHVRTLQTDYADEFRPGVENSTEGNASLIDLSDEFERQFFGDLMLFSVAKLCNDGIKPPQYHQALLEEVVATVEQELLQRYDEKLNKVNHLCDQLSQLIHQPQRWWNQETDVSIKAIQQFIDNCQHNFSAEAPANQLIQSTSHRQKRKVQIITALLNYQTARDSWDSLFINK